MAEIVHFKAFKARSQRPYVEVPRGRVEARLPELCATATARADSDIVRRNPETLRSLMGVLNMVIIPLVILLCSIAAFAVFIMHLSEQPAYSAQSNSSPPPLVE